MFLEKISPIVSNKIEIISLGKTTSIKAFLPGKDDFPRGKRVLAVNFILSHLLGNIFVDMEKVYI